MNPLKKIGVLDLRLGKQYLIEYAGTTPVSNPRFKGTFVGNIFPECEYGCILSKFTNVLRNENMSHIDLRLQDYFYVYYEADALKRAYTTHVLQQITGDDNFIFNDY